MSIRPYLKGAVFDPRSIQAMSMALDDVCAKLGVNGNIRAKEVIATRISSWRRAANSGGADFATGF
jgi:hypothetical protein